MQSKKWLNSADGAFIAAIGLTIVVFIETVFSPSAPFFWVYAALAIIIPLYAGIGKFSWKKLKQSFLHSWKAIIIIFIALEVFDIGSNILYQMAMESCGLGQDPNFSMQAAIPNLAKVAAMRLGITENAAFSLYGFFFLLWAPIGEEFFYRGYLQKKFSKKLTVPAAIIVMALIFGLRHAIHFFYLWPNLPIGPMIFWMINATVWGVGIGIVYQKTKSITLCIIIHFVSNIIIFAI